MAVVTTHGDAADAALGAQARADAQGERARLEREEIDARGFVTNLERLLVAVDDSANGKLAARIAGVIGGADGKPTTVLKLTEDNQTKKPRKSEKGSAAGLTDTQKRPEEAADHVKSAAEGVTSLDAPPDEEKRGSVDVTTVRKRAMGPDEIEAEARKATACSSSVSPIRTAPRAASAERSRGCGDV